MQKLFITLLSVTALTTMTACGKIEGIPSHGGGKRYAVEQELIASSARATVKSLDIEKLKGKRVALRMVAIGDQGAGNLVGGRYTIEGLLRGEYLNTPTAVTDNTFPTIPTTTTTNTGGLTSTIISQNAINAPGRSETETEGFNTSVGGGVRYQGLGDYQNSTLITNAGDTYYLLNLLQTYFYLQGVEIVDPANAEVAVFVTVDVFGTVRSREDWHVVNQENLLARTSLEMMAIDLTTGKPLITPKSVSYEAKYEEKYALWTGPYKEDVTVKQASKLAVTFEELGKDATFTNVRPILLPEEQSSNNTRAVDPITAQALEQQSGE